MIRMLRLLAFAVLALVTVPVLAQDKPPSTMDLLREKTKADKKLFVAVTMQFTESEARGFWPLYEGYQADLDTLNARLRQLIVDYAREYRGNTLTDERAQALLEESLAIEQAESDLKRGYVKKLSTALPGVQVARYIQIENKIRAVLKYDLAEAIPLAR